MAMITAYWVYLAIGIVGIAVGRMWGRNSVLAEIQQAQQAQLQQQAFAEMMNRMKGGE